MGSDSEIQQNMVLFRPNLSFNRPPIKDPIHNPFKNQEKNIWLFIKIFKVERTLCYYLPNINMVPISLLLDS